MEFGTKSWHPRGPWSRFNFSISWPSENNSALFKTAQDKAKRRKIIYNNTDNTINTNHQMGATTAHLRRGDEAREPGSSTTTSGSSALFRLIQSKVMRMMMIKKTMMMNLQQTHDREITAELFKGCKLFTPSRESQYRSPYIPNSKFRSLYAMNT